MYAAVLSPFVASYCSVRLGTDSYSATKPAAAGDGPFLQIVRTLFCGLGLGEKGLVCITGNGGRNDAQHCPGRT